MTFAKNAKLKRVQKYFSTNAGKLAVANYAPLKIAKLINMSRKFDVIR